MGALGACAPFFPKMPSTRVRDVRGRADGAAPNAQPFSRELCLNCASVVPGAREHPRVRVVDAYASIVKFLIHALACMTLARR